MVFIELIQINNFRTVRRKQRYKMDDITWCRIFECQNCGSKWSIVPKAKKSTARCERCKLPAGAIFYCKFIKMPWFWKLLLKRLTITDLCDPKAISPFGKSRLWSSKNPINNNRQCYQSCRHCYENTRMIAIIISNYQIKWKCPLQTVSLNVFLNQGDPQQSKSIENRTQDRIYKKMVFAEIEYRCAECGHTSMITIIVGASRSIVFPCSRCQSSTLQYSSITRV